MVHAWSIGTSKRTTYKKAPTHYVPGSGTYQPKYQKTKKKYPGWKIGSSKRRDKYKTKTPGPGNYNTRGNIDQEGSKYNMALKTQKSQYKNNNPGPGTYTPYDLNDMKDKPRYTFGLKPGKRRPKKSSNPGPGNYEHKSTIHNRPSSKFGRQKRDIGSTSKSKKGDPGPNHYKPKQKFKRPSSATCFYKFGQAKRGLTMYDQTPGPGQYNTRADIAKNNKKGLYKQRKHPKTSQLGQTPGPGAYNPKKWKTSKNQRIGTEQRSKDNFRGVPGPGSYNPELIKKGGKVRIGSGLRKGGSSMNSHKNATPGPGNYKTRSKFDGPQYGITPKRDVVQSYMKVPGPGRYQPELKQTKQKAPGHLIGTGSREDSYNNRGVPGPGSYKPKKRKKGAKWRFGTQSRVQSAKVIKFPGPGTYESPSYFADVPKYLMYDSKTKEKYYEYGSQML